MTKKADSTRGDSGAARKINRRSMVFLRGAQANTVDKFTRRNYLEKIRAGEGAPARTV
jgi:hypothetical protein